MELKPRSLSEFISKIREFGVDLERETPIGVGEYFDNRFKEIRNKYREEEVNVDFISQLIETYLEEYLKDKEQQTEEGKQKYTLRWIDLLHTPPDFKYQKEFDDQFNRHKNRFVEELKDDLKRWYEGTLWPWYIKDTKRIFLTPRLFRHNLVGIILTNDDRVVEEQNYPGFVIFKVNSILRELKKKLVIENTDLSEYTNLPDANQLDGICTSLLEQGLDLYADKDGIDKLFNRIIDDKARRDGDIEKLKEDYTLPCNRLAPSVAITPN